VPEKGKIPVSYDNDREAIMAALSTVGLTDAKGAKVIWIKNTLELTCMRISETLAQQVNTVNGLELLSSWESLPFDEHGDLPFGFVCD
jgi:hypothetical protein